MRPLPLPRNSVRLEKPPEASAATPASPIHPAGRALSAWPAWLGWRARPRLCVVVLGVAAVLVMLWALGSGAMTLGWREILDSLWNGWRREGVRNDALIWSLRLPRIVMGFVAGGALGICGAALQGLFRNPLADPALIGVSGGGAMGAAFAIVLGVPKALAALPYAALYSVPLAAFAGAFVATAIVYSVSTWQGQVQVATLLLAGIAINAIAASVVGWLTFMASDAQLRELSFWSLGSVGGASWRTLAGCFPFVLVSLVLLLFYARPLNMLALGESNARHMGAPVEAMKRVIVIAATLSVGAVVSFTGTIGFIGLVAPHLFRFLGGPDHRWALPGSFLMGGCLLCAADVVARVAAPPVEIPVGIVVATLGAPFFLFLLMREKKRGGG